MIDQPLYKVFALPPGSPQGYQSAWLWRRNRDGGIGFTLSPWTADYSHHLNTFVSAVVYGDSAAARRAAIEVAFPAPEAGSQTPPASDGEGSVANGEAIPTEHKDLAPLSELHTGAGKP